VKSGQQYYVGRLEAVIKFGGVGDFCTLWAVGIRSG